MEEHALSSIDYADYVDYSDDADAPVSFALSNIHVPPSPPVDVSLQNALGQVDVFNETKDVQSHEHHQDVAIICGSNCNQCNQRNQSVASSRVRLPCEDTEGDLVCHVTDEPLQIQQACVSPVQRNRCPHHPHTRWVRFDPSGQAWCDRMDFLDCYRLMKIGEALGYQRLLRHTSTTATIGQGKDVWVSFVLSQRPFTVMTAIDQAEALCEALGIEVPDLTGEVRRLVPAW